MRRRGQAGQTEQAGQTGQTGHAKQGCPGGRREPAGYTLASNLFFHLKSAKQWNKWVCYFQFLAVVPGMTATFLGIWLPSLIVSQLQGKVSLAALLTSVIAVAAAILACSVVNSSMQQYLYRNGMSLTLYYDKLAFRKTMKIDYELLERQETQKLVGNIWNVLRNEFAIRNSVTSMPVLIASFLSSLLYGVLLCLVNPGLAAMHILTIGINIFLLKRVERVHGRNHEELGRHTKEIAYINRHAMERSDGKDIRIYQMQDWFMEKYDQAILGMDRIYGRIHTQYFIRRVQELGLGFLTELASYGYLAWLLTLGQQSVAQFVFSVGLVRTFSANFSELIGKVQGLNAINSFLSYLRKLLDLPEAERRECRNPDRTRGVEVEFRHVSFRYPGAETDILHDINLTIHSNEKLALIGLNGAGKTTLVKLLCGFYKPVEGAIYINGTEQSGYDPEEYRSLISALFQDSMLFPLTLDENLTAAPAEEANREELELALEWSGFGGRYESLPNRGRTRVVREVYGDATDFSGGEKQKLLFARALYRKAPLLILDEPTAALDPIAEHELYLRYGEAARGRTVIFISHRLSSTRFCDRIVLLEGAGIVEEGIHEELLKKGGRYAELFEMQSRYYRNRFANPVIEQGERAEMQAGCITGTASRTL